MAAIETLTNANENEIKPEPVMDKRNCDITTNGQKSTSDMKRLSENVSKVADCTILDEESKRSCDSTELKNNRIEEATANIIEVAESDDPPVTEPESLTLEQKAKKKIHSRKYRE